MCTTALKLAATAAVWGVGAKLLGLRQPLLWAAAGAAAGAVGIYAAKRFREPAGA